jgi:hypothetical protein
LTNSISAHHKIAEAAAAKNTSFKELGSNTLLSHSGLLNLFKAITGIEGIAYRAVVNHSSVET